MSPEDFHKEKLASDAKLHGEKLAADDRHKKIDRLLALWIHANTLLWGRLQTLSVLQATVIGGWWVLSKEHHRTYAFLIVTLGLILTLLLLRLIHLDVIHREDVRRKIDKTERDLLADGKNILNGRETMQLTGCIFVLIDFLLLIKLH